MAAKKNLAIDALACWRDAAAACRTAACDALVRFLLLRFLKTEQRALR
jgi:hypothetical protein